MLDRGTGRARDPELSALVASEAEHRVRTMLGVVRMVVTRTADTAASPEAALDHLRGRLDALGRHQAGSVFAAQGSVDLEDLIRDELLSVGVEGDRRVAIKGPEVRLDRRHATSLGLAIHELVTNSVKFGVLSNAGGRGRLRIAWAVEDGRLLWEWVERGVPVIAPAPLRHGFGREFIEDALPHQTGATTVFELAAGGIRCAISLPYVSNLE